MPQSNRGHDLARSHRHFGSVDTIGTEDRAAAALGALVEITVPVVQYFLRQVHRTNQFGEVLSREGEISTVNTAHQVLARHWHIFGITGSQKIMAFVRASAAVHTGVHIDLQRPILPQQFPHFGDGFGLPIIHQRLRESQCLLNRSRCHKWFQMRHGSRLHQRNDRVALDLGCFESRSSHSRAAVLGTLFHSRRPGGYMSRLARCIGLVSRRAEEQTRCMQ